MELALKTQKRSEVLDVTLLVKEACRSWGGTGLAQLFCPHTTAGVAINENCDPTVKEDLLAALGRLVPEGAGYAHSEGNADAHIKAVLTGNQILVPVQAGKLKLGRWQGIYFCEFDGPRPRTLWLTFLRGEA